MAGAGCVGLGPGTTARTLEAGQFQVMARQTFSVTQAGRPTSYPTRRSALEVGVHYGATSRIELGGRLGPSGGRVDGKLAFLRSPSPERGLDLSIAPSFGLVNYSFTVVSPDQSSTGLLATTAEAPLLLGLNLPGGSQLIAGAGPWFLAAQSNGLGIDFLGAEFLLAASWRVTEQVRLVPGLACVLVPTNDVWQYDSVQQRWSVSTIRPSTCEVGLSLLVGGGR